MLKSIKMLFGLVMVAVLLVSCADNNNATEPVNGGVATDQITQTETVMETPTEAVMTEAVATEPVDMTATEAATAEGTAEGTGVAVEMPTGEVDCMDAQQGDQITMLYQWSGLEEENFNRIIQPLVDTCGIVIAPESSRDQALLDTRVQAGTPPDIAFYNVTQLNQYSDILIPMDQLGANTDNYASFWRDIGTVNDAWLGLPVKADPKTLIWYSPARFEEAGYAVPETWADLEALVDQMVADGKVPWSMGFESGDSTGWTGTDFVEDILLVKQGPQYIMDIIDGTVPYSDDGVREAYEIYGKWATDAAYTVGGAQGTVSTSFTDAIHIAFSDPPEAMMVKQSGFAGAEIQSTYPDFVYGTDYDFFGVPEAQGLQGGSDWMMAFNDTPAIRALVTYLTSDYGGQMWAYVGFDTTPNQAGTNSYSDEALLKRGQLLANTEGFVPDIGDSIPGGFGSEEFRGITDYVNGGDLGPILDSLAQVQADAVGQ